jgi:hypothetical protein
MRAADMSLTGSVMVITPLDGPTTSKTVLVIDEHMGIHPENYAYIKDQYEDEAEFKEWYNEDDYATLYLSTGEYIQCDEMTGVMSLNNLIEIDYEIINEKLLS